MLAVAGTADSELQYQQLDISSSSSVTAFADWLKQQHGKLDILVNNAGKAVTMAKRVDMSSSAAVQRRVLCD